ncbi:MAG: hypothetical protein FJ271_19415 [Planctomycetes bacterium]|nr:hypothetical protein [Planctomycetota bacterium]
MNSLRDPNTEPIAGYRLIEPIGSGGFGEVWKCEAPGGIFKAIKFVYGNLNSVDVDAVRAEQELKALNRIKEVRHPFICSLDRIESVNGELIIVMELADRTLHDMYVECQAAGLIGIPRDNLLRYMRDAAEALDFMNGKHNLQHLDVKPRNLFLIGDRVKVADFGLVRHLEKLSMSGLLGGVTPLYAPPETFNGKISERSDQYSLAIVYQELLTGQRPFAGKNVRQLAQQHMQGEPNLRAIPEAERPVMAKALAKDPAQRFANCMTFVAALYRSRQALPVRAPAPDLTTADARPKSLHETMEDILLDGIAHDASNGEANGVHVVREKSKKAVAADDDDPDEMGITIPQPETGALRPTLVIGLGGLGRKALLELRCRFLDRFGDLSKLPLMRFLCIDVDPEAANLGMRGAPDVALTRAEVHPLPLQPVVNYRRRAMEALWEWLPREKLYAMPRSLQTQGSRALGRLAFSENQQRLLARLKRDIQEITNADVLYQAVSQTGLALRDHTPRIFVIAAAGGGGSGMLADLGFGLRRLLAMLRHPDAPVTCFLLGGAPSDPASSRGELANLYATLTELNHYSDPSVTFAAQYGAEGQRIVDEGSPYSASYFLSQANRSPDALEESLAHLGSYLFHEITTPLGRRLDHLRYPADSQSLSPLAATPLRSFGTYAVWFPRGLLLRLAARQACRRLIEGWLASGEAEVAPEATALIHQMCERIAAEPELHPDAVARKIESSASGTAPQDIATGPADALARLLAMLDEQSLQPVAQDDPISWSRQAFNRVREWVGAGAEGEKEINEWRKTRLNRSLAQAAQNIAEEWDQRLANELFGLMELPGARLAVAESALVHLQRFCQGSSQELRDRLQQQAARTAQTWGQLDQAMQDCAKGGGGFRLFSRSRARTLRVFVECLAQFARQRLAEEVLWSVRHFFIALQAKLADRARDFGFCRQRLRHLQEQVESGPGDPAEDVTATRQGDYTLSHSPLPCAESFWEMIRQSATARVVLPDGKQDLERAAIRFLQKLSPEQWVQMDRELNERVLLPRGGLQGACVHTGDLTRMLAVPLMEETSNILSEHLPIMDVAQILAAEFGLASDAAGPVAPTPDLAERVRGYLDKAAPLVAAKNSREQMFLLVPASPAGKVLGEAIHTVLPDIKVVRVPGQSDLMFCREQGFLQAADLRPLLASSRPAYQALAGAPVTSPHARFDISDWVPIDP